MPNVNQLYTEAAYALIYAERLDEALVVSDKIEDTISRVYILQSIAGAYAYRNQHDKAREVFGSAVALLDDVEESDSKTYVISAIIYSMITAGFVDEALVLLDSLDEEEKVRVKELVKARKNTSHVSFKQDADGAWWFIGLYSNKFKDKQDEIISEDAHQKYVEWVNEKGVRPQVILHHMPRLKGGVWSQILKRVNDGRIDVPALNRFMKKLYKDYALAETERVFYSNGFVGVVAKVHEGREEWVERLQEYAEPIGMSHGFVPVVIDGNIYEDYRSFEFTVLPQKRAANQYTTVRFLEDTMDKQTEEFLNEIQSGAADEIEEKTRQEEETLETEGVAFKDLDVDELVKRLNQEVVKSLKFKEFAKALGNKLASIDENMSVLNARVEGVEKTEDERVADLYAPVRLQGFKPTEENDPKEKEDGEQAKEAKPFDFISAIAPELS